MTEPIVSSVPGAQEGDKMSGGISQRGSSLHAIIIAVLFVALMATLGIVFYQNFVAEKPTAIVQEKPKEVPLNQTTTHVAFNSDLYSFDHMNNWKVTSEKVPGSVMDGHVTKITSPNGSVQATFSISEKAASTQCDSTDGLKISFYHVGTAVSNKLAGVPLYLVESISDAKGGGYQYRIGLTPDSGDTHAVVDETHCNVGHVGIAASALMKGKKLVQPTIIATINFPKLPAAPKAASKDMQTIKDLMDTDDYRAAIKILGSARKE